MSPKPRNLEDWLAHCERLHTVGIDMGLERVREVAQRMALRFDCPVITVAGTNGKGSTCAMLEAIALEAGWRTGLYTSPHLVHFQERCRLRGEPVDPQALVPHFARVEAARQGVSLTYFEFTTLAILSLMAASGLDVAILEVGLGGRLDAVNIIDRATELGCDLWLLGRDFNFSGDKQQWAWAGRSRRYPGLAYPALRGANQLINASGVLAALTALRERLPVTAQAVRNGLALVELPGRFQIVPGQPTLVLDVAHNPHSVGALVANLDAMGFYPTTHLVFGAMADKDLDTMFQRIGPLADRWYFCDLPLPRAEKAANLQARWQALGLRKDASSATFASPREALAAATAAADPADRIVVFGSFYTVGGILEGGVPRLQAQHIRP